MSPPARPVNVHLTIEAHRFITETTGEFAEDVTVSVRSDDPAIRAYAGSPGDARPGAIMSFTEACTTGCDGELAVVVRGTSATRPADDIGISGVLSASAMTGDQAPPLGTELSITFDDEAAIEGMPTTVTAQVAPTLVVSEASPATHIDLRLDVDPLLLREPLAYPLVGSLTLRAVGDAAAHDLLWDHWASAVGRVTVDGEPSGMAPESGAYDIDWLRLCTAGQACSIDVGVDIAYDHLVTRARINRAVANESDPPPPAEFRLTLDALARLEAFDERDLPSDGLSLVVDP